MCLVLSGAAWCLRVASSDAATDNFGSCDSLSVVLIFSPEPAAFEVRPRGLLHSVSVTPNVALIRADGRGEHVLLLFYLASKSSPFLSLHGWARMSNDVEGNTELGLVVDRTPGRNGSC